MISKLIAIAALSMASTSYAEQAASTFDNAEFQKNPAIAAKDLRSLTAWDKTLVDVANKERVPAPLLAAICWVESHHRPEVTHYDDGGTNSIGLCQIKLTTAQHMGYTGSVEGLYNGKVNAKYAAKYIRYQLDRFNNDWTQAISAYNMGTPKMSKKRKGELVNQKYVNEVWKSIRY